VYVYLERGLFSSRVKWRFGGSKEINRRREREKGEGRGGGYLYGIG